MATQSYVTFKVNGINMFYQTGIKDTPSASVDLNANIYGVWNADTLGTSLDTSIYRVYNGDNVNDTSGNAQNGTNVGSVTFTTGKVGNAFTFNGSNYISLPNNSLNSLTGDFTINMWVNVSSLSGFQTLLGNYNYVGGNGAGFVCWLNTIQFEFRIYNGATAVTLQSGGSPLVANTWRMITIVRNGGIGSTIFMDGVASVSNSNSVNPGYLSTQYCTLGNYQYVGGPGLNSPISSGGKLDGVTVWNKALTANEILGLYNSGTGSEYPFTSQTLPSLNDALGNYNGTRPSSTLSSGVFGPSFTTGKIGQAFLFDGVNDCVALPNNSLDLTGDFSISMWVNYDRVINSQILMSNFTIDSGSNTRGWFIESTATQLRFRGFNNVGADAFTITASHTPSINTWIHYVFVHKNFANKMYANGSLIGSYNDVSNRDVAYLTPNYPMIGANKYNSTTSQEFFKGKIDAVSVWSKELSATEVTSLYNSGNGKQYPFT